MEVRLRKGGEGGMFVYNNEVETARRKETYGRRIHLV